jgi:hemerythrin
MLSINYPEYAAQKQAHTAFIAELEKIKREFESSGGSFLVIMNANKLVIDWLTKHISNMDKKIGEYAKQQKS